MSRIPDSRQESGDPVCDGLKLIDHHLYISCQVLAVLQPDDGGLEPGIGDVDGAVEFSLMALWQLEGANGGLEVQPSELLGAQINPWNTARSHKRLRDAGGTLEPRMLSCV